MENVVIAGSGPAGLTAAIYTARAMLNPILLEGSVPGGQLIVAHNVENYPGFFESIPGIDLMERFRKQALRLGVRFKSGVVKNTQKKRGFFEIDIGTEKIKTKSLVIATGAETKRLSIPTEPKFYGKGVSGCVTCDGSFFRDKKVLVVGGGNTAIQDAVFLTKFASKVTIVNRRTYLRAASVEIEKARKNHKIQWLMPWTVEEISGNTLVTGAVLKNSETGKIKKIQCNGIFVAIGQHPISDPFKKIIETDMDGFIKVKAGSSKTSTPGVFACGDVSNSAYKQAIVAAGHGCIAALDVEQYIQRRK